MTGASVPAEVTGDPPVTNVAAHLPRVARERPYAPAIHAPAGTDRRGRVRYVHYTYRQLDEASDRIAHGLGRSGVGRGTRTALMVRPSLELFALVFGLFKAGAVPVMIDPGIGLRRVGECLARARPEAFIGVGAAHAARLALRWGRASVRTLITVGPIAPWGGPTLGEVERRGRGHGPALSATRLDDPAAILFTSGSTGPPKGAVYTHGTFLAQVEAIRAMYGIRPGEVDLPTFPLFALFDPALGMTTVIPDMDPTRPARARGDRLVQAIEDFGVTTMFGSPALVNALSRYGVRRGVRLPSLRRVISAGAPVGAEVLARMRQLMPEDGVVATPYGATECLPVATIESREVLDETAARTAEGGGVCVGYPVPEAEVRIVAVEDGPIPRWRDATVLPAGEIGEIVVRGPMATREYFDEPEPTGLAKIRDEEGSGFAHRMGDLGYLDGGGRLWFCGRKGQRVETARRTYYTAPCEGVFNAHPAVHRSALVRLPGPRPGVCLELEEGVAKREHAGLLRELRARAERHEATRGIERFLIHPGFPVDVRHNAKIRREELAAWAARAR